MNPSNQRASTGLLLILIAGVLRTVGAIGLPYLGLYPTGWGIAAELAVFAAGAWILGTALAAPEARRLAVHEVAAVLFGVAVFSLGALPTVVSTVLIVIVFLVTSRARVIGTVLGAIMMAFSGLVLALALAWLGGGPVQEGNGVRSQAGVFVATSHYASAGAWGSNHWIVYVGSPFMPLLRRQVYLGPDGEPPAVVWVGHTALRVNGRPASVF